MQGPHAGTQLTTSQAAAPPAAPSQLPRSMDSAYDQIQEKNYAGEQENLAAGQPQDSSQAAGNFNAEVQEAYKAISSSPWAARLGGFWQTAKKQGEQYYETAAASKQYQDASAGVATLLSQARNLSVQPDDGPTRSAAAADSSDTGSRDTGSSDARSSDARSRDARSRDAPHEDMTPHPARPDSLTADIVNEAQGIVSLFRANASKRLKELQHAEDAADEALLKFGSNLRNLLADAVTIAAPASRSHADNDGAVLFESRDSSGNKAVHATRFDAQLHVIHSTLDSFLRDPTSPQWEAWKRQFDADSKTDAIANHVAAHAELRTAMEKLVPERVDYATFWSRYYFLRHVIESEEQRRREMLKGAFTAEPVRKAC